jgi:hypothetical protein
VKLDIRLCRLADDAVDAFVEFLQSDGGPVELHICQIDWHILATALTGQSRVARFSPTSWSTTDGTRMAVFFRALANNRGLVDLDLRGHDMSNDNWSILCESLKAHPTLTSLELRETRPRAQSGIRFALPDEQKTNRTRVLSEMVKQNTVLQTIHLSADERDEKIYTEKIHPYLETNRYIPRVLAVKKTFERPLREKVLGRVLYCVRSNPNLVWMFLSENVDAFVRSEEEGEEESNSEVPVADTAAVVEAVAGSKRQL